MFSRTHFCLPPQDDGFAYAFLDRPFVAHQQQLQVGGVGGVPAAAGHALFNPAAILAPAGPQHSPAVGKPPPRGPASYRYEKPLSSFDQELTIWIDHPVASMSISPSSRDVVLASRRGLIIIDLENPYEPPRILTYVTRWEVADVQWNPHRAREDWVASASNQKAVVWNLSHAAPKPVEEILHGHDRAISDVNWSPHVPEVLATCSVDAYVHLWDLRSLPKPAVSFCAWTAGATTVKFNRKNEYMVASTHDRDLRIWDTRNGSVPVYNILAHRSRISGVDWSRTSQHELVTCSQDKTVKFWNLLAPEKHVNNITTAAPLRRARHTPFGKGLITMPERTEAALTLWKAGEEYVPVHTFRGHRAAIREFVWRVRGDAGEGHDEREFQLITWSKDQHLRLWPVSRSLLEEVGHVLCPRATVGSESAPSHSSQTVSQVPFSFRDPPILFPVAEVSKLFRRDEVDVDLEATAQQNFGGSVGFVPHMPTMSHYREHRSLSPLGWMQSVRLLKGGDNGLTSVSEEIAWLSARYHHGVEFEKLNFFADNSCTIALRGPWSESGALAFVRVRIVFPPGYPREASPRFEVQTTEMISATRREQISRSLDEIAAIRLAEHSPCLEECIRFLLGCSVAENGIDSLAPGFEDSDDEIPGSSSDAAHLAPDDRRLMTMVVDRGDANVPFPRMCGAVFGPDGKLAYFLSPLASAARRGVGVNTEEVPAVDSSEISGFGYCHPRSYETLEQYRALSMLAPRAGGLIRRINTDAGLTGSPDTASLYDGSSSYDEFDEINELTNIPSLYFKFRVGGLDQDTQPPAQLLDDGHIYQSERARLGSGRCIVTLRDFSTLLPISAVLGRDYSLSGADPVTLCYRNADAARAHRRPDLSRIWQLAALVLTECVPRGLAVNCADSLTVPWNGGGRIEWAAHPLGTKLVEDLLNHYNSLQDVQTCAMLTCILLQSYAPNEASARSPDVDYFTTSSVTPHHMTPSHGVVGAREGRPFSVTYYPGLPAETPGSTRSTSSQPILRELPHRLPLQQNHYLLAGGATIPSGLYPARTTPAMPTPSATAVDKTYRGRLAGGVIPGCTATDVRIVGARRSAGGVIEKGPPVSFAVTALFDEDRRTPDYSHLVNTRQRRVMDANILAYAEHLYRWGLLEQRAEALKYVTREALRAFRGKECDGALELRPACLVCGWELGGCAGGPGWTGKVTWCSRCEMQRPGVRCAICHLSVKGVALFCLKCGHGGHTAHLRVWFTAGADRKSPGCPEGCGCDCLEFSTQTAA